MNLNMKQKWILPVLSSILCANILCTSIVVVKAEEEESVDLVIHYRIDDENGDRIALTDTISLPEDSDYSIEAPEIEGYTIVDDYSVIEDNVSNDNIVDIVYTSNHTQNTNPALGCDFNLLKTPLAAVYEKGPSGYKILILPEPKEEQEDPFDNIEDLINGWKQLLEDQEKK